MVDENTQDVTESPTFKFDKDGLEYKVDELTQTQRFLYDLIQDIQQQKQDKINEIQQLNINEEYMINQLKNELNSERTE